jgi:iron(III) transport system substrate-binding protein
MLYRVPVYFLGAFLLFAVAIDALAASAPKAEWERAIAAAEQEGQVTIYGPPGITYQNAINAFQDAFPKIKLVYVAGSGTNNAQRLVTERRAGKYQFAAVSGHRSGAENH